MSASTVPNHLRRNCSHCPKLPAGLHCMVTVGPLVLSRLLVPSRLFPAARHLTAFHESLFRSGRPDFSQKQTRAITTSLIYPARTCMQHAVSMPPAEDAVSFDVIVVGAGLSPVMNLCDRRLLTNPSRPHRYHCSAAHARGASRDTTGDSGGRLLRRRSMEQAYDVRYSDYAAC